MPNNLPDEPRKNSFAALFVRLWGLVSHNIGLKLLALVLAILLWNFVVTSNTSITRTKTLTDLTGYITSQSTLNTYGLALLENPDEELGGISVQIEVAQSEYAYVSPNNVQVMLDLSRVRTTGVQEVPLRATTSYGRVVRIVPDSLPLTFEPLDSRVIPVNVQLSDESGRGMWCNVSRSNPSTLTISGAASLVQRIASASVFIDASGYDKSFITADRYLLLDSAGEEIPQSMLNCSSTSVSVSVDVYPTREIPIAANIESIITGQIAPGYVVESVTIQPDRVTVAADAELLDSISELHIEPIDAEGASQSFAVRAAVSTLSAFRYISAEEVYVTVNITEETIGAWAEDVPISYINKGENLTLDGDSAMRVYITGPRSAVEDLLEAGFTASVPLDGLDAGTYQIAPSFPTDAYPTVTFTPEQGEVSVTLTEASE